MKLLTSLTRALARALGALLTIFLVILVACQSEERLLEPFNSFFPSCPETQIAAKNDFESFGEVKKGEFGLS
ncbi:MAG TPA: hypothetical protein VNL15_07135, partial [Dehalococcoidia bacterium]|nr:hypothetical protein [Dehalococcoidia bacterium]